MKNVHTKMQIYQIIIKNKLKLFTNFKKDTCETIQKAFIIQVIAIKCQIKHERDPYE